MIACVDTTESLTVTLGGSNRHDFTATFEEIPTGGRVGEGTLKATSGSPATTAAATIMAAPGALSKRVLRTLFVRNTTVTTTTVTLSKVIASTVYAVSGAISLASGESFCYGVDGKITMYTSTGIVRTS